MLVKDCMTRHPIMVGPETPASEAQKIMSENSIRHLIVAGDGKRLLGLITRERLAIKPDILASLNVWEITRHLSNLTVAKTMLPANQVRTIEPEKTIERAARIISENRIGALPVIEDDVIVGVISEIDLLGAFQVMLGLPTSGVRVTIRMPNQPGEFTKLMQVLAEKQWGVMGIGTFPTPRREGYYDVVLKIPNASLAHATETFNQLAGQEVIDIREGF